jgi:hypothetical protein
VGDRPSRDELALARHDVHVLGVGAHVARGVVAAADRLDEAAVGPQQRLVLVGRRVPDDHGLAAAEVEAGQRRLVRHPAREVEHVADRVGGRRVGVEAGAAQAGAEGGRVDRDDGPQPGGAVVAEDDLLVLGAELEDVDTVDAVDGGAGGAGDRRIGGHAGASLTVAPRGWVACGRATRGGVTHLAR